MAILLLILTVSSIITLMLTVWFKTEAWLEYARLFDCDSVSFYKDFDAKRYEDASLTYHIYLRRYHNCFFTRLITCPICLSIWLGYIIGFMMSSVLLVLGIFSFLFLILAFANIILVPIYIVVALVVFKVINHLFD